MNDIVHELELLKTEDINEMKVEVISKDLRDPNIKKENEKKVAMKTSKDYVTNNINTLEEWSGKSIHKFFMTAMLMVKILLCVEAKHSIINNCILLSLIQRIMSLVTIIQVLSTK